jgi:hypothetical protein
MFFELLRGMWVKKRRDRRRNKSEKKNWNKRRKVGSKGKIELDYEGKGNNAIR